MLPATSGLPTSAGYADIRTCDPLEFRRASAASFRAWPRWEDGRATGPAEVRPCRYVRA
jgi:hypothetical protein